MNPKLIPFFIMLPACIQAENLRQPDVRACALGGNGTMLSTYFNPALIPLSTGREIGLSYSNRYMVKELGAVSASFLYPNDKLSTGVFISTFGYEEYRETMLRLAVGKQLGEHWALGVGFQYSFLQTVALEHTPSRLSVDVGVFFMPVEKLSAGLLIKDLPSVKINRQGTDLECFRSFNIEVGFQYEIINNTLIALFIGTDQDSRVNGGIGIEYAFMEKFFLRGGLGISPIIPTMGAGYVFHAFRVDVAATYHNVLGVSLAAGLSYHF